MYAFCVHILSSKIVPLNFHYFFYFCLNSTKILFHLITSKMLLEHGEIC